MNRITSFPGERHVVSQGNTPANWVAAGTFLVFVLATGTYFIVLGRQILRTGQFQNQRTGEMILGIPARRLGIMVVALGVVGMVVTVLAFVLSLIYWMSG